jgi:hypothetical protein
LFCDENGICNEKRYWSETPLLIFSWSKFNICVCPNCALKCANYWRCEIVLRFFFAQVWDFFWISWLVPFA